MVESAGKPTIQVTNNADAPFIYFDTVGAFGALNGAILLELIAHTLVVTGPNATKTELVTVAHIRCSPKAAADLQNAIERALEVQGTSQNRVGPAN
jgi:hypothetical protein